MQSFKRPRKGNSKKLVAKNYDIVNNTVSKFVKNKKKFLASLEKKGPNSKRLRLRSGDLRKVDRAVYTWIVSKRSQQIPIDGVILK